jgi:excisionase family DNA binding protein
LTEKEIEKGKEVMTAGEVADMLGFSSSMVHKLVNQNKIPYFVVHDPLNVRKRRAIRFNRADVLAFVAARNAETKTEKTNS